MLDPAAAVLEIRAKVRLYKDLADQRTGWQQRLHATLYHLGAPAQRDLLAGDRDRLARIQGLSPAARQAITVALAMIEALDAQIEPLRAELTGFARRQPGCQALQAEYGIGALTSVVIWSELGDTRRFAHSRDAVRHAGLDITVYSSDTKRSPGRLSRQGSPLLRWALYEAARCAARTASPDHGYYRHVADRLGGQRAALSVARKLARRCHHHLRALGEHALAPPPPPPPPPSTPPTRP